MQRFAPLALAIIFGCRPASSADPSPQPRKASVAIVDADAAAPSPSPPSPPSPPPSVATDWCIEGLSGLDEETCYLLPPLAEGKPRRLLVYLHGITPPVKESQQKTTVQSTVKNTAARAGAAAIIPRGRRGIGPGDAKDWYAWPTSPKEHIDLTPAIAAKLVAAKKKLEEITGVTFERTYLAGSSNGAYYLAALALRGDLDRLGFKIDGYGAMSGGAANAYGAYSLKDRSAVPIYIGYGAYDEETKKGAKALGTAFENAKWPVRVAEHPFGHGAREVYLDEAFKFWDGER